MWACNFDCYLAAALIAPVMVLPHFCSLTLNITLIKVTRLNGKGFVLNAVFIETVETFPDTTITLTNGRKYVVKESEDVVMQRVKEFYQSVSLLGHQHLGEDEDEE